MEPSRPVGPGLSLTTARTFFDADLREDKPI